MLAVGLPIINLLAVGLPIINLLAVGFKLFYLCFRGYYSKNLQKISPFWPKQGI